MASPVTQLLGIFVYLIDLVGNCNCFGSKFFNYRAIGVALVSRAFTLVIALLTTEIPVAPIEVSLVTAYLGGDELL